MVNNSLKEYYIKLHKLYNNAVNMITAMNQSLSTASSEVSVTIVNDDDTETTLRIPSMVSLENRFEQLDTNFSNLFNMPESGEAWFEKTSNMYKLHLVRSNSAPLIPEFNSTNVIASITDNNFLKDLVSPKTYLKLNVTNLPDNIEKMFMKKIIFNSSEVFNSISNMNLKTYEDYVSILYTLTKGIDYEEYDSIIDLPIKSDVFNSKFEIVEIIKDEFGNDVWSSVNSKSSYKLVLNTLQYHNQEDSSIEYTLKAGDYICLGKELAIYKVKNVNIANTSVEIEEYVGHIALQTFEENSEMILSYYNEDYSSFHYVQVPLEENQYICVFLGTIYNNTRSLLSTPYLVNLDNILMYDAYNNAIYDNNGNHMSYISYYKTYCTNIGDLILGLTQTAYPQISNYNNETLNNLQSSDIVKAYVTNTINGDNVLQVVPINKHLIDNTNTEQIINLNAQKSDLNSQLSGVQENINNLYNTLINTDFSQKITITQIDIQSKLQEYYTKRSDLQKQLNSVIDNINSASADVTITSKDTKYRVRGISDISKFEEYLYSLADTNVRIIGLECEYKYKSVTKDTTNVMSINSNLFSDWNRLNNIDRQRQITFNQTTNTFNLDFVDYSSTQNIIKWNQIDIPIVKGEDVILRVRYKYNIGQPFIDLYTPWSDELTMVFPTEYIDNVEVTSILNTNSNDIISAKFNNTLINEGYQKHITNSLTVNNVTFYHMPENIYSGFNTSNNEMISLKDKLNSLDSDLQNAKILIDNELNKKFSIYLTYDNNSVEIFKNTINTVNIYNTDHVSDAFIKKNMNIVIKNTGTANIQLYSIFPGNTNIPLLLDSEEFYVQYISHYERVPIIVDNDITYQTLGQWIYFRQDNPYTNRSVYYNNEEQNKLDYITATSDNTNENKKAEFRNGDSSYIQQNYNQMLLAYRKRLNLNTVENINRNSIIGLKWDETTKKFVKYSKINNSILDAEYDNEIYNNLNIDFFLYNNVNNNYLLRFEDLTGTTSNSNNVYLDSESSISEFLSRYSVNKKIEDCNGAFLYPNIAGRNNILTDGTYNGYIEIPTGSSVSVPIVFEYFIDGTTVKTITKALYFDIRDSLVRDPQHYMIELIANYDYTATGTLMSSSYLIDDATDE